MNATFYLSAAVATLATIMTITRLNAMHALLYMVVSLFAVAVAFYVLGAPFAAALEVIVYAGAIMVLFVFVVMMILLERDEAQERAWLAPRIWIGPSLLAAVLLGELAYMLTLGRAGLAAGAAAGAAVTTGLLVGAHDVGALLFGPYLLAVEIGSMLLLAGLVGAYRLGHGLEVRKETEAEAFSRRRIAPRPAVRT